MTKPYKEKSQTVHAVQFTEENKDQVFSWAVEKQNNVSPGYDRYGKPTLLIPLMDRVDCCHINDYIIHDRDSVDWCKLSAVNHDVFNNSFEPVMEITPENYLTQNASMRIISHFISFMQEVSKRTGENLKFMAYVTDNKKGVRATVRIDGTETIVADAESHHGEPIIKQPVDVVMLFITSLLTTELLGWFAGRVLAGPIPKPKL